MTSRREELLPHLRKRLSFGEIDRACLRELVTLARREDLEGYGLREKPASRGDVSSRLLRRGRETASARLVARENLVLCGMPLLPLVLEAYSPGTTISGFRQDGEECAAGTLLGEISGPGAELLAAERVALNFLQRLSGIATRTAAFVHRLAETETHLLDTRKTTPGFRVLEKYATGCGGGYNHRIGLFDRVMLKDNHLAAEGSTRGEALAAFVRRARCEAPELLIELEVDDPDQIPPALDAGVDILLLDNFSPEEVASAVRQIGNRAVIESSGGIDLDNLPAYACAGADFLSTGATVHQARWSDIGLDWKSGQ
ncbi:MAG: carboxylating nicotinate-nucleotide diphosphorylase [Verrucomicrobia bacterium]|jgi:nicotinate-nucleotide pyrophosphorylase (carboxylating)|nr:carboxylating nicotinate-nucleotide diphosphorylase [Verrucomicrobiota bacterium]